MVMKAIHVICKQVDGQWTGYERDRGWAESWIVPGDPAELRDGWIYFHQTYREPATLAARIYRVERLTGKKLRHVGFRVVEFPEAGQTWRGERPLAAPGRSHGAMVEADLPHELMSQAGE